VNAPRPRLYRGWRLIGALSITEMISWGILYYGFGVFLPAMEADLGWSREALTGAFSLALLTTGIVGAPLGRVLDRDGPRVVMTVGSIAAVLAVVAWSRVDSIPLFYVLWAAIGAIMAATFYEPAFVVVANWFVRRRSLALTILTFGGGLASVVFIPLNTALIDRYGWRDALLVDAAILAAITVPLHAFVLRRRPADVGLEPDGGPRPEAGDPATPPRPAETSLSHSEALRTPAFWWISIAFCLTLFANVAMTVHAIAYLRERDFTPAFAASVAGAIGLVALPGRLIFTPLGGILPRRLIAILIFGLQAVAFIVLALGEGSASVWMFVALFGAGFGAITPARAQLTMEFFGSAAYGAISGSMSLVMTFARALAPFGASLLVGAFGGYDRVIWILAAISLASCVAIGLASPPRKPDPIPAGVPA
jgi:sugar phosphate permease